MKVLRRSATETATSFDVTLGASIRQVRREAGVSQAALAEALGISFQQVQKYESGANRVAAGRLVQIAAALHVSAGELLGEGPIEASALERRSKIEGARELLEAFVAIRNIENRRALTAIARQMFATETSTRRSRPRN
jgi:transcriptional regulator with XRE-family HTH domain